MAKVTKRKTKVAKASTKKTKAAPKKAKAAPLKRKGASAGTLSFSIKGDAAKNLIKQHGGMRAARSVVMKAVENLGTANAT